MDTCGNRPWPDLAAVQAVKLLDHFGHAGDVFFRLRSYLPLLLLPAFVLSAGAGATTGPTWQAVCEAAGFLLSLAGFGIRVITIGSAPPGTSERSTRDPRASLLNTSGAYSVVRHPLYLGNTLVALGLAVFTATWYLPVIVALAGLLYHERICVREEVFLEAKFGDAFRSWAGAVPALLPALSRYRPSSGRFQWRKVVAREFHALFVLGAGFLFLDVLRGLLATGQPAARPIWTALFAVTGLLFLVLSALKKWTSLLRVSESAPGPTGA
jgi:protein-S-isoprenylcysteine O-methyltransferase Ste14